MRRSKENRPALPPHLHWEIRDLHIDPPGVESVEHWGGWRRDKMQRGLRCFHMCFLKNLPK